MENPIIRFSLIFCVAVGSLFRFPLGRPLLFSARDTLALSLFRSGSVFGQRPFSHDVVMPLTPLLPRLSVVITMISVMVVGIMMGSLKRVTRKSPSHLGLSLRDVAR